MCNYWYRVIKANYGERAKLAYEDTDSFIFSLDILTNLNDELKQIFSTSKTLLQITHVLMGSGWVN